MPSQRDQSDGITEYRVRWPALRKGEDPYVHDGVRDLTAHLAGWRERWPHPAPLSIESRTVTPWEPVAIPAATAQSGEKEKP